MTELVQLTILFFVIIDPFASFSVFIAATKGMTKIEKKKITLASISVALILSYLVLIFGKSLFELFSTSLDEFRIAGGIILCILGLKMSRGQSTTSIESIKDKSTRAIASIIGTPLLTGPATITTIMVASSDYGKILTGVAFSIVLALTAGMFLLSGKISRYLEGMATQVLTTILGMITLAWGVKYIIYGIKALFFLA